MNTSTKALYRVKYRLEIYQRSELYDVGGGELGGVEVRVKDLAGAVDLLNDPHQAVVSRTTCQIVVDCVKICKVDISLEITIESVLLGFIKIIRLHYLSSNP